MIGALRFTIMHTCVRKSSGTHTGARAPAMLIPSFVRHLSGSSPTDKLALDLSPLARQPKAQFLAGLAGVCDVKQGKLPNGTFAWVLVPIGADASADPLASLRSTPGGVLFGAAGNGRKVYEYG